MKKKKTVEDLDDFLDVPPEEIAKKKAKAEEAKRNKAEAKVEAEVRAKAEAEVLQAGYARIVEISPEVPAQVRETLKEIAKKARKPLADVHDLFNEVYNPAGIEMVSDTIEGRCEYVLKYVRHSLFSIPSIYGNPSKVRMEFKVLHVSGISTKKLKGETASVAYVTGVFQTAQDEEGGKPVYQASFGILTLFNDALQALNQFMYGRTYRMTLYIKVRLFYMELSKYDFEEPDEVKDNSVVLPAPTDVLTIAFEPIDVKDVEKHIGFNRLLQGTIGKHEIKVGGTGKQYGIIELVDFSDKKAKIKVSLFDNPQSALYYPEDTEVFVICTIDDNEKWGLQAIGKAIVPLHEMPRLIDNFEMTPEENEAIFGEDWLGTEGIDWDNSRKDDWADDWNKTNISKPDKTNISKPDKTNINKPDKKKKSNLDDFDLGEWL